MQPSASLAKRPSSSQRSGAISTTSRLPSPDAATPSLSWTSPRASVWVGTLVRLQRVLPTARASPQSAGPNDEPDEARGRQQPEAYVGVRAERQTHEARAEWIVR